MPTERDPGPPEASWVELPSSDGWAAFDARLRSLTGRTRVVVVRVPSISDDAAAPTDVAARERVIARLCSPDTIHVATIEGRCAGDGLAVALACDLRLAGEQAFFDFGSAPPFGALARLARLVTYPRALELCLTGRRVPAAQAAAIGLVNLVVGGGQVADAVGDLTAAVLATPRELATELKRALLVTSSDKISNREEVAAIVRLAGEDEPDGER